MLILRLEISRYYAASKPRSELFVECFSGNFASGIAPHSPSLCIVVLLKLELAQHIFNPINQLSIAAVEQYILFEVPSHNIGFACAGEGKHESMQLVLFHALNRHLLEDVFSISVEECVNIQKDSRVVDDEISVFNLFIILNALLS